MVLIPDKREVILCFYECYEFNYPNQIMPQLDDKQPKEAWWSAPVQMFLRVSGWIALPLIISLFLGQWLDQKFSTAPWLLIVCSGIAFMFSMYGIVSNAKKEFKKIEDENKNKRPSSAEATDGQEK
jgi:F0F1-type ATP synthase assembly protein I